MVDSSALNASSFLKAVIIFASLSFLSGCGGDSEQTSLSIGVEEPPVPDDVLWEIEPANFDSEEEVVLLAPGALFRQSVGAHLTYNAVFDPLEHYSPVLVKRKCNDGIGSILFHGRELEDVLSPFSGDLFDVVSNSFLNCTMNVASFGDSSIQTLTNGDRHIGFPRSGYGSLDDPETLIVYESQMVNTLYPFSVFLFDNLLDATVSRNWRHTGSGHFRFVRPGDGEGVYGDSSAEAEMYYLNRFASWSVIDPRDNGTDYLVQLGTETNPFQYSYTVPVDDTAISARSEHYRGVYGIERRFLDGVEVAETCPKGRFAVDTLQDLSVQPVPEGVMTLDRRADEVISGAVEMTDVAGNRAIVTYDGSIDRVFVTLNGGATREFTYQDLNDLLRERCIGG